MHVKKIRNAPREHSAILSTFIKLLLIFKTFVLFMFEWSLKTGLNVLRLDIGRRAVLS